MLNARISGMDLFPPGVARVDRRGEFKLSYKLFNTFDLVSFKNELEENPYACFCARYYPKQTGKPQRE